MALKTASTGPMPSAVAFFTSPSTVARPFGSPVASSSPLIWKLAYRWPVHQIGPDHLLHPEGLPEIAQRLGCSEAQVMTGITRLLEQGAGAFLA